MICRHRATVWLAFMRGLQGKQTGAAEDPGRSPAGNGQGARTRVPRRRGPPAPPAGRCAASDVRGQHWTFLGAPAAGSPTVSPRPQTRSRRHAGPSQMSFPYQPTQAPEATAAEPQSPVLAPRTGISNSTRQPQDGALAPTAPPLRGARPGHGPEQGPLPTRPGYPRADVPGRNNRDLFFPPQILHRYI